MIINGASRSNARFFSRHLMRADDNERVHLIEMRGLIYADDIPSAFQEMEELASGTRCKNYFYHANLNTRADERLSPKQWVQAVDTLERELGLDSQPRFIVEHEKAGRTHRHVIWSRIDADTMTAISDSLNYQKHERAARAIEAAFGHEPVPSVLVKDRGSPRPERAPRDWESFRAQESGLDPKAITAEVTALWMAADSGQAFAAALEAHGYILVRGDRRDFCLIDPAGDEHSLARRIAGVKAAQIRARMADIDRAALPSVEEGRAMARQWQDQTGEGGALAPMPEPWSVGPQIPADERAAGREASAFDLIMAETIRLAAEEVARAVHESDGFARWRSWLSDMRDYVAGWRDQVREWFSHLFGHDAGPEPRIDERGLER